MAKLPKFSGSKHERAEYAIRLAQMGDLEAAEDAFLEAIEHDRHNLDLPYNLSIVEERLGDIDRAAELLTVVLHHKPDYPQAAARLSRLLARFQIEDPVVLIPSGLGAALRTSGIAHQPVVDVTLRWLLEFDDHLSGAVTQISEGADEHDVGRTLVAPKLAPSLTAGLLLAALRGGIVKHAGLERLLTGVRAAIVMDCAPARFEDRDFTALALALVQQGWNNDHAWAETAGETAWLDGVTIDRGRLVAGDPASTANFLKAALYRPLDALVTPPLTAADAHRLKPRSVREVFETEIAAAARRREKGAAVPSLRPLSDPTSRKVAGQYETAPYPRWQSLHLSPAGALKASLQRHFVPPTLAFMDGEFDVLIAGCGTGQQALQAAAAYGAHARLLALDLSRASLGYAADMLPRYPLRNVRFMQGDILDVGLVGQTFDIVECVGVLHHMADWRAGWLALLDVLKPGGLMYVGLYSATSRAGLAELRANAANPGPGCTDQAARAWRRSLLTGAVDAPDVDLLSSADFYALSSFRDLMLHESETLLTLQEIEAFLDANGLDFRGFTLEPSIIADFEARHPASPPHGSLADWSSFETANPRTFDGMYRFWVERRR